MVLLQLINIFMSSYYKTRTIMCTSEKLQCTRKLFKCTLTEQAPLRATVTTATLGSSGDPERPAEAESW
jgi:hypothetical protein